MAQHVAAMVERGRTVVFSPLAHPCYPLWVGWQTVGEVEGNKEGGLEGFGEVEGREWDEMEM